MNARRRQVKMERETSTDRLSLVSRFSLTLLFLAIILYVASFFVVRTDGFRYVVEERLSDAWEWPVRVERVWLNPDWSLVMSGIESEGFEHREGAGLAIRELRVRWSPWRLLHPRKSAVRRVYLQGGVFSFQPDADGVWRPAFFHADAVMLAEWCGVATGFSVDRERRFIGEQTELAIGQTDVFWWNRQNELLVSVQGMTYEGAATRMVGRSFRYRRLTADSFFAGGRTHRDIAREFMWVDERLIDLETGSGR